MVLTFKYVWEIIEYDHGFKKATEQCCPVILFNIMMFKVVQTNGVGGGGVGGEFHFYKNRWRSSTVLH